MRSRVTARKGARPGIFTQLHDTFDCVISPMRYLAVWQLVHRNRIALTFTTCCVCIAAISVHDAVLVLVHYEVIGDCEQNPLGRWLIQLHGGDVWLFVLMKFAGTALACALLVKLYQHRSGVGVTVAAAVACFQLLLLLYLHLR